MNRKITIPKSSMVENDEFFYRHPEMYRPKIDDVIMDHEEKSFEEE